MEPWIRRRHHTQKGHLTVPRIHTQPENWANLRPGDRVTVSESGRFPYQATVDELTDDSSVIWVFSATGAGRRAFAATEGIDIRSVSHES